MAIETIIARISNEGLAFEFGTSPYNHVPHSVYAHVSTNYHTLSRGYAQDNGRAFSSIERADFASLLLDAYNDYRSRNPKE